MTTLQPRLVRADTLDLQSHNAPSAQDHSRSANFAPYNHAAGAHHREALRNAEQSAYNDQMSSPRRSMEESHNGIGGQTHMYDSADDDGDEEHHHHEGHEGHQQDGDYENGELEDEEDLDDDLMDKISSSPSIEDEDIDFEFVYALHTFVATVEGQANATKGDTMVLLDDSNSYWWLVRVVKDGSIGYLPAEHIETPTERLARLNKHRNIDLAASMLGDNPEKSKNPLKKAMRRRNAKSVAFAAPTYYEPSDYAYSSDEDEEGEDMDHDLADQSQQIDDGTTADVAIADGTQDGIAAQVGRPADSNDRVVEEPMSPVKAEGPVTDPQIQPDENFRRTRNGVVRNTDSFFKDDTVETKKISLTPRLLRGDSEPQAPAAQHQPMSTDTFDKLLGDDRGKDDKKKKEKKGMLSGLFKRKDKKGAKADAEDVQSMDEPLASPTSKDSMESISTTHSGPERKLSKLQKTPPTGFSPKTSPTENKSFSANSSMVSSPATATTVSSATISQTVSPQESVPRTSLEQPNLTNNAPHLSPADASDQAAYRGPPQPEKRSIFAPLTTVLKPTSSTAATEPPTKAVYAKKAKERFAIDSADSDEESAGTNMQTPHPPRHSISPMLEAEFEKPRPESEITVSPIDSGDELQDNAFHPGIQAARSEEEAATPTEAQVHSDTASTSKPSPSLATHTPSTSRSTPTWSDASLRTYMDNDQDIRDLLIIVHDKSNVTPVGADHPLMGGLFTSERTRLAEMQSQLDSMLTTWISKKNPGLLAK